jgi:surface protein
MLKLSFIISPLLISSLFGLTSFFKDGKSLSNLNINDPRVISIQRGGSSDYSNTRSDGIGIFILNSTVDKPIFTNSNHLKLEHEFIVFDQQQNLPNSYSDFSLFLKDRNVKFYKELSDNTLVASGKTISCNSSSKDAISIDKLKSLIDSNSDVTKVCTSNISDMSNLFYNNTSFNQNISSWDTSHVSNMNFMFKGAINFNQNINTWDVSNVVSMSHMFDNATFFNSPLSDWDVSNVVNMKAMFANTSRFNQNINSWDVSSVSDMSELFSSSLRFNQPLFKWNTINVVNMGFMFYNSVFDQSITVWNTNNVSFMSYMFANSEFNKDISSLNLSSLTDSSAMFKNAKKFNHSILHFKDISVVTDMALGSVIDDKFNPFL